MKMPGSVRGAVQIAVDRERGNHCCVLYRNGTVGCWGELSLR